MINSKGLVKVGLWENGKRIKWDSEKEAVDRVTVLLETLGFKKHIFKFTDAEYMYFAKYIMAQMI